MKEVRYRIQTDGQRYNLQVDFGFIFHDWRSPRNDGRKPGECCATLDYFISEDGAENWAKERYGKMAKRVREWRTV